MTIGIRDQTFSSEDILMALFARMDSVAMSIALAILLSLGLAIATAVLLLTATPGVPVGPNLSALGNVLPGYSVTWPGCLIGAAWAALVGAILGFFIAACWNFTHVVLVGLVALLYQPSHLAPKHGAGIAMPTASSVDQRLISSVVRLNVVISAVGAGLGLGLSLLLATFVSLTVSDHPGRYLNLLAVFMPGYSASTSGAWFGLLWGIVYGAVSGGIVAWLYGRTLGAKLPKLVVWDANAVRRLRPPVLRISSYVLGPALGLVAGLQLLLATTWLVVRGTAHESVHAQLLSNYLPDYTVSLWGGLFGGLELFLIVSLGTVLATSIYDYVAYSRNVEQPTSLSRTM
jgi:hypothetical protein